MNLYSRKKRPFCRGLTMRRVKEGSIFPETCERERTLFRVERELGKIMVTDLGEGDEESGRTAKRGQSLRIWKKGTGCLGCV